MKRFLLVLFAALFLLPLSTTAQGGGESYYISKEAWDLRVGDRVGESGFDFVERDASLPNVLIIGSSISIGYTPYVQQAMRGEANVYRIPESSKDSNNSLAKIEDWLSNMSWDVIHMNIGMYDICRTKDANERDVPADLYRANMSKIISTIINNTSAQIIWATITYVPEGVEPRRVMGDELLYNDIVDEVFSNYCGAMVDNQYSLSRARAELQKPRDVHFTSEGYEALAKQAVSTIREALNQ
ncbi:MAG: SGNH/GDSL hydrolase family protein [Rikenellaceae bacterium]